MKKYLSYIATFIAGIVIGSGILTLIFIILWSHELDQNLRTNVSRLENMASKVYAIGDVNSSIVVLNELARNLENYRKIKGINKGIHNTITTDLGLTYARLFVVYERMGEKIIAEQEYQKTIELVGNKFKVNSPNKLKEIIEKIDKSTLNSR